MALGVNPYNNTGNNDFCNINVYSARIYDKALTQEEIENNYNVDRQRFNF